MTSQSTFYDLHHLIYILGYLILFFMLGNIATTMEENVHIQLVTDSINQFSLEFYKEAANEIGAKNMVVSPFSAEISLALLSLAARGDTKNEILNSLHIPNYQLIKLAFKTHLSRLISTRNAILNISNKIYIKDNESFALNSKYIHLAEKVFSSEIENVDFESINIAVSTINSWSDWRIPFEILNESRFHVNPEKYILIDVMRNLNIYRYAEIPEWNSKVLEVPYVADDISMVIFLTDAVDGLSTLERKLENCIIEDIFNRLSIREVSVTIPKFKIESHVKLNGVLSQLGMNSIFDREDSELSDLLQSNKAIYISEAVQRAFIDVNENSTEIFAPMKYLQAESSPSLVKEFRAQHPFFFIIKHKSMIIFCGKYTGV